MEPISSQQPQSTIGRDNKRVVLLGCTGVGKSATANTLIGDSSKKIFKEGHGGDAGTTSISFKEVEIANTTEKVILIDVPGTGDPQNRDKEF